MWLDLESEIAQEFDDAQWFSPENPDVTEAAMCAHVLGREADRQREKLATNPTFWQASIARLKAWTAAHPERHRANVDAWHRAHPERVREIKAESDRRVKIREVLDPTFAEKRRAQRAARNARYAEKPGMREELAAKARARRLAKKKEKP